MKFVNYIRFFWFYVELLLWYELRVDCVIYLFGKFFIFKFCFKFMILMERVW